MLLGDMFHTGLNQLLSRGFTSLSEQVYSSSATMDYTIHHDNNSESLISASFSSPFVQYVQASAKENTHSYQADTDFKIYDSSVLATDVPSKVEPLDTSDLSEDMSLAGAGMYNEIYFEDNDEQDPESVLAVHTLSGSEKDTLKANQSMIKKLKTSLDTDYLIKNFFYVNKESGIDKDIFNVKELLNKNLAIKKKKGKPQILIFHTHAHETFADSKKGVRGDSIVGVGDELTRILEEEYGYEVLHYSKQYDFNNAYTLALKDLKQILNENPSIEVILDVHRDGVNESNKTHTAVKLNGISTAKIMFFNGVSHTPTGPRKNLYNKNLQTNLAFSLQMKLFAMENYPELTKKNFIKSYRFNMHLVGRYSLVEVGDNNNTVAEVKAAMIPLAASIDHVLSGKK